MPDQAAHSMCVSLRIDPSTLDKLEADRDGATLSASMGIKINNTLCVLAKSAKGDAER